jgi:hypothetical protein
MGITDGVIEPFFLFCPEKERKKQKKTKQLREIQGISKTALSTV